MLESLSAGVRLLMGPQIARFAERLPPYCSSAGAGGVGGDPTTASPEEVAVDQESMAEELEMK